MPAEKLTFELAPGADANEQIYCMQGPMVLGSMFAFQQVLRSASTTTILDMTAVPYLDSAGLGVLTNAYVTLQKNGHKLLLVGANERIHTLLEMTKLDSLLKIYPSVEAARQAK